MSDDGASSPSSAGPRSSRRRPAGAACVVVALLAGGWLYRSATDFPQGEPVRVVDAELLAYLRANPELHLPLDPNYRLEVELELQEDGLNRAFYGTEVDLREPVPRDSIHIQRQGDRMAIHADGVNPTFGFGSWLVHATLDVPATPLIALGLVGFGLLLWPPRPGASGR